VTKGEANEAKVIGLMDKGVRFHLCDLTVKKMTKKKGKSPSIIEGVNIVPSGTVKIMDLQEAGYSYLKP
jgi:intracellular sulfur oxidation DsrE/DsrF family protein